MIHRVSSNRQDFRAVSFEPGFNVVLAERTIEASDKESRNGSGKTSLVEIIHFCLGGDVSRGTLGHAALRGWSFSLDLDVAGQRVTAERNTAEPRKIWISGSTAGWPIEIRRDEDTAADYVTADDWKTLLSRRVFGLTSAEDEATFAPSARGLLSYFIRRGRDAFTEPFSFFRAQPGWSKQVHVAALLGLDWRFPRSAALLKQQEDRLRTARNAVEEWRDAAADAAAGPGLIPGEATEGSLEATRISLSVRASEFAEQLAVFRVHPQYREYEGEASRLTSQIHDLVNENVVAREVITHYVRSLQEEESAPESRVNDLYAEMDINFPEQVVERIEAVRAFHQRIAENRREYLGTEIARVESEIEERDRRVHVLSDRRAELLAFLAEHGALEEFLRLQQEHQRILDHLARLEAEVAALRSFEVESAQLRIKREELHLAARRDFDERRPIWTEAIELFASNTGFLYEHPGQLILDVTEAGGLSFKVEIERAASQGVQEMVVFAYDLMLAQRWAKRSEGLGVLVHDSTIFDGVDERQVARALRLASTSAEDLGFQYICFLNSDQVPWQELEEQGMNFREAVSLELTDAGEDGGLFGIRFG